MNFLLKKLFYKNGKENRNKCNTSHVRRSKIKTGRALDSNFTFPDESSIYGNPPNERFVSIIPTENYILVKSP